MPPYQPLDTDHASARAPLWQHDLRAIYLRHRAIWHLLANGQGDAVAQLHPQAVASLMHVLHTHRDANNLVIHILLALDLEEHTETTLRLLAATLIYVLTSDAQLPDRAAYPAAAAVLATVLPDRAPPPWSDHPDDMAAWGAIRAGLQAVASVTPWADDLWDATLSPPTFVAIAAMTPDPESVIAALHNLAIDAGDVEMIAMCAALQPHRTRTFGITPPQTILDLLD